MPYQLKGGEEWRSGVLYGWTGRICAECQGVGQIYLADRDNDGPCPACGGTGEEYGRMPEQPTTDA